MRRGRKTFGGETFRRFKAFRLPLLALVFLSLFALSSQWQIIPPSKRVKTGLRVVKVIDGDTVVLSDGQTVRYIGVDTPEHGQPFYEAAKNFNRSLVQGKAVELEFDVERYDHYGRLLAYVFVRDKSGKRIFVNAEMVRNGFARIYTRPPNVKYADLLLKLQKEARANNRGLWSVYKPTRSPVIGNRRTMVFHRPNCPAVRRISPQNRVSFHNAEAALEKGFHPCRECQP
ncbi:MAG: thermonuclease family protein [Armatimonadetes bacterium]|nr:thermonuclease family protein [Armatimonadota bacterium]MCX7967418.1 thermonuclease family protein [Armatimonadota bacterium]MDW8142064.1 thermonuclease family protein [Armatimonadota bacterium]